MKRAVIGIGTNLGDRMQNIEKAVQALKLLPQTAVVQVSPIYETEPFEVTGSQADFLNCCVLIQTALSPCAMLGSCLGIEAGMGRRRQAGVVGERPIDLDLLLYEGVSCDTWELKLPHPQMLRRAFVLAPLSDLFPEGEALQCAFQDALQGLEFNSVHRWGDYTESN